MPPRLPRGPRLPEMPDGPMHNAIANGRFSQALARVFRVLGQGAVVPQLASELVAVADVNDQDATQFWARSERLCGAATNAPAIVGATTNASLTNPTNSGMLVILEDMFIQCASAVFIRMTGIAAPTDTAVVRVFADGRFYGASGRMDNGASPVATCAYNAGAIAAPADARQIGCIPPYGGPIPFKMVLRPGDAFYIAGSAVNVGYNFSFRWRERPAYPEELPTST